MNGSMRLVIATIMCACGLITGCTSVRLHKSVVATRPQGQNKTNSLPHVDGTIASMTILDVPNHPDEKFIHVFYWSGHQKVEAYVIEPAAAGVYPIDIILHGGHLFQDPSISHDSTNAVTLQDIESITNTQYVVVIPEYSGYGQSQGPIQDIYGNVRDADNAITFVKSFKNVNPRELYVEGTSMGGCVALMLAERSDVKGVVATSPFIGWTEFRDWADQNPSSKIGQSLMIYADDYLGSYDTNRQAWDANSPDISKIKAPVLLLQGTGDSTAPWQSVQTFYKEMLQQGKTVQLDLFPNGNHGLTGKYANDRNYDTLQWFANHW